MLIIGHRGAAGERPENSLAGVRHAIEVGVDIVEFDIRLTRDKIPVLAHDFHTFRMNKKVNIVSFTTFDELKKRTANSNVQVTRLDEALKECYDKVVVNVEIKTISAVKPSLEVIRKIYQTKKSRSELILSSFNPLVLRRIRKLMPDAQLSLLHSINPLEFIAWHKMLNLSAVGFHRLHINPLSIDAAKSMGLFVYAYTVNRPEAANRLERKGVDAIITDVPSQFVKALS